MRIVYLRDARNPLKRLPANLRTRFLDAFEAIAQGKGEGLDVAQLTSQPESRLRVGDFRAIFVIHGEILTVTQVGPRGDVYKR